MRKIWAFLGGMAPLLLFVCAPQAHAVSKEIIQLQTQVQQLQDAVQHLQDTQTQQLGILQHVVQQISDSVGQMNTTVTALQRQVAAQNESGNSTETQLSTQMQGINDSVDELRGRLDKLAAQLQAIQSQLQTINTPPAQQTGQPGAATPGQPGGTDQTGGQPGNAPGTQPGTTAAPAAPPQPQAPPVAQLYQSALSDYEAARYDLASSEFGDVIKYYPENDLAGNAQFYLGEIAYRQGKYSDAIQAYEQVLEQYAGNAKAPAALLRKAESELATDKREAGIRDLRALIARYPQTPEAAQARSRLNGMGVRIYPKPNAGR